MLLLGGLWIQSIFTGSGYGPGRCGKDQGSIAGRGKLLWEIVELQERWDTFLESSYNCTHQGRKWKSLKVHWVSFSIITSWFLILLIRFFIINILKSFFINKIKYYLDGIFSHIQSLKVTIYLIVFNFKTLYLFLIRINHKI